MARKTDNPLSNIAVIYARFSSHNQREESIEQQVAECKVFAAQQGLEIVEVYADAAQSGRTEKRSQFLRLQRDAKKGKFANIIAYKSNRIARNMMNALNFENEMEKLGIKLFYAKEEFGNNAAGRFALRMMMNVNQFYSENMAEDIRRGMEDNARNCKCNGICPFGYRRGEDGKPVPDENTGPIVQEIFTRVACGEQFQSIAADLNSRGIKTTFGKSWGKGSFQNILMNERYTGVYIYDNIRIENGIQPLISKELYMKVQKCLHTKGNPQGRHRENGDYLLSGKLFCGECGRHMMGMSGTGKSGTLHYYYACQGKKEKPRCTKKNVRREELELTVARIVKQYILRDEVMEWLADTMMKFQQEHRKDGELSILQTRLSETKKSIANIMTAIEQGIITSSTKERLLELESEQSKIRGNIAVIKSETVDVTKEQIIGWLDSFRDGDINDKDFQKRLFDSFLRAVYLYDDGRVRVLFNLYGREDGEVDTSLMLSDTSAVAQASECSYKDFCGSPSFGAGTTAPKPPIFLAVPGLGTAFCYVDKSSQFH
ncbi:MAG: recombinase family protein [Oscillospiraceae bacterium]|nr:recombinase family protein [Oscillospiraceae bacterium]